MVVNTSTISGNSSPTGGGILINGFSRRLDITVSNSTISNNTSVSKGAGLYARNVNLALSNTTVSGNEVDEQGGGLFIEASSTGTDVVVIENSTISDNTAASGGGIFQTYGAASLELANSIVANNQGGDVRGDRLVDADGINIVTDGSVIGALTLDPRLGPLQDNGGNTETRALLPDSPAINLGSNDLIPSDVADVDTDGDISESVPFDQRGSEFDRVVNEQVDLGAVEFQGNDSTSIIQPGQFPSLIVDTLDDENDFDLSPGDVSLREAIAFTQDGGTIEFDPSLAGSVISLKSALAIDKSLTIDGLEDNFITLDAAENDRVFIIDDGDDSTDQTVVLDSLIVTNGDVPSDATISDRRNAGGGIFNRENLTVRNSRLVNNASAGGGGGIFNDDGVVTVLSSTISGNTTQRVGGGIFNNDGSVIVRDSTISGNISVDGGGGLFNTGGTLTVNNSTIANNSAVDEEYLYGNGGGIATVGGMTVVSNSTISNNVADYDGGVSGSAELISTIVANNTANFDNRPDTGGESISARFSLIENGDITNDLGNNIFGQDPKLDPAGLQDNGGTTQTIALQSDSPALNRGDNPGNVLTDQRGETFNRVVGERADIGAFEVQADFSQPPAGDSFYFSADNDRQVGGININNQDILFFDGQNVSIVFDGSNILSRKVKIDAFDVIDETTILMSFNQDTRLRGIGEVDDSDIVQFNASSLGKGNTRGRFELVVDGSDLGLTKAGEDIDALTQLSNGDLLFSTKRKATFANGVRSEGEDILLFRPRTLGDRTRGRVSRYVDGSDINLSRGSERIDAIALRDDELILSTRGNFRVPGLSGRNEDAFGFTPTSLGRQARGTFTDELVVNGDQLGLSGNLSGIDLV
ncbi:MAG: right-handed parallel beta-helix repeat-containing protein [Cyanobacteria bacterium J06633_2]